MKSILARSVICGLVYLIFPFLIIFVASIIDDIITDSFTTATVFGIICGTVMAFVTNCGELKRTVIARIMGVLSVIAADMILFIADVPYRIILYIYRNDFYVREMGRLTLNETIGYAWSMMFFEIALPISFAVVCIGIFIYHVTKNRRMKKQTTLP